MTKQEFLEKSRNIHGYKYKYVDLKDVFSVKEKVKMLYNDEEFEQTVEKHLMGRCPEKNPVKLSTKEFILKSKKVWGDKYDYSESEYKGSLEPIKIIHEGYVYYQRAQSHLDGITPEYNKNNLKTKVNSVEEKYKKEIEEFLNHYSITYEKNKILNNLNFSFYLTDKRIIIEYYSEHHYTDKYLTKERIKKREYCEEEFINLIEFNFKDRNILWELLYKNLI